MIILCYFRKEIKYADDKQRKKPIIPLMFEDVELTGALGLILGGKLQVRVKGDDRPDWDCGTFVEIVDSLLPYVGEINRPNEDDCQ